MMNQGEKKDKFELLKEAFDALNHINEEFYRKIEELQRDVFSLQGQVTNLENDNQKLQSEKNNVLEVMSERLENIEADVAGTLNNTGGIEQMAKVVGKIENSLDEAQSLKEREQQVEDAEDKIRAALAAKEEAEVKLKNAEAEISRYKSQWESAKTQAQAAARYNANVPKDNKKQHNGNVSLLDNTAVQNQIKIEVMKKTTALEEQHARDMDEQEKKIGILNSKIDDLTTENESLKAENEELRKQLQDTNQASDDLAAGSDLSHDLYSLDDEDKTQKIVPAQDLSYNFTHTPSDDDDENGGGIVGKRPVSQP